MKRKCLSYLLLLSILPALLAGCQRSSTQAKVDYPVPIIQLRGTPDQLGAEHARQLGPTIHTLMEQYLGAFFSRSRTVRWMAMAASTAFESHLRPEHRAELQALADHTSIDERQVMLGQCFLDLVPLTACSTVTLPASAASDGIARFGRNLDFPSFDVADKHSVIFVYRPEGRNRFVAIGWPGMIGVLSGMNEHGLTLANMEVKRSGRPPAAMPYTLLYRTVLERCKTVDEAVALLQSTPRQTANNLMLMDAAGNRAVVEITPQAITVRRGDPSSALISTNHQRGQDTDTPGRCSRYDALHNASQSSFGRIDERTLEQMLHQARSMYGHTLQSMIFEPSTRTIYLSTGHDATKNPYAKLDLKPYFAK